MLNITKQNKQKQKQLCQVTPLAAYLISVAHSAPLGGWGWTLPSNI